MPIRDRSHNQALEYILGGLAEAKKGALILGWADHDALGPDAIATLIGARLVRRHSSAASVVCSGCEEACPMPVEQREAGEDNVSFIVCDKPQDLGRIALGNRHLDQWYTDIELVASCVADIIGTRVAPNVLIPNTLVRLGHVEFNGMSAECFIAHNGSEAVLRHSTLKRAHNPLVLHAGRIESTEMAHLDLARALFFRGGCLCFVVDSAAKALSEAAPLAHENIFRRTGQMWEVRFQVSTTNLGHTLGIGYIAELLQRPREPMGAIDLYAGARTSGRKLIEAGLEVSDRESLADLRKVIKQTQAELARARAEKALGKADELEAREKSLQAQLTRDFGKSRRARVQGGSHEKSRQNVQKAIRVALAGIAKAHPALGAHLKATIRTGRDCVYDPVQPTRWKIIL